MRKILLLALIATLFSCNSNEYKGVSVFEIKFEDGTKAIAKDRFHPLNESIYKSKDTVSINSFGWIDLPTSISKNELSTSKRAVIVRLIENN